MKRLLLVAPLALLACSCAFMNARNRPLMNYCERTLTAEDPATRNMTAPLVLPVCLLAGVVDTAVVHPLMEIDQAWYDTRYVLWGPSGRGYVTECALIPVRAAATSPFWALTYARRLVFDSPAWPSNPERLARALAHSDPRERLLAAQALQRDSYSGPEALAATKALLDACRMYPRDIPFCETAIDRLPAPLVGEAPAFLATLANGPNGRLASAALTRLFRDIAQAPRDDKESAQQLARAVDRLAVVYDELVKGGRREAEIYLTVLAAYNSLRPGPQALGLYIARSLGQRGWPDYADAAAFLLQRQLLRDSAAARIAAVEHEWRALRVRPDWPQAVAASIQRLKGGAPPAAPELLRQQNEIAEQLKAARPGQAAATLALSEQLIHIKTLLDAEDAAARLLKGPQADMDLFMGDPLDLLRKKGGSP